VKFKNPLALFKAPPPPVDRKPTNAQLFDDTAMDMLAEALISLPDQDKALEAAGMTRADLERMTYDDEISAALDTRLAALQGTPWRINPGEGEFSDFLWDELKPVIEPLLAGAWNAVPYGYSVIEVIYARRLNGRVGIDRIEERPMEWFAPTHDGKLRYFPQDTGGHIDVDTRFKFLLTRRDPTYRNPYGKALLSRLYAAFFLRQAGWKFWPQFLERFGAPLLVGKTAGDTSKLAEALAAAVQAATLAVDERDSVEAIGSTGDGAAFERFEAAVIKRIQKVILGQTLTTDVCKSGSYAAANVHNMVRQDRKLSDVRLVTRTVQHLVDALAVLNRQPESPTFILDDGAGLQLERAERDAKLAQAGIARFTDDYLMRAYEFEREDFEIPEPREASDSRPGSFTMPALKLSAADDLEADSFTPGQQAIEDLADDALRRLRQPIPATALRAAIRGAKDPEDLAERLSALYEGQDAVQFRRVLERALFAADVLGYVNQEEDVA
jgi:phage gp29-like protein